MSDSPGVDGTCVGKEHPKRRRGRLSFGRWAGAGAMDFSPVLDLYLQTARTAAGLPRHAEEVGDEHRGPSVEESASDWRHAD